MRTVLDSPVVAERPRSLPRCVGTDVIDTLVRDDVDARLQAAVASSELGEVLRELVVEHLASGGKRTRARLALASAHALGLDPARATSWAAACELLHNATLVHDDIQDGDRIRRGRPALWARHGVPQALNAGDALLMLPMLALDLDDALDDATRWRLTRALVRRAVAAAAGQSLELELSRQLAEDPDALGDDTWADYLEACRGKTSQLLSLPFEGAALLAGADAAAAHALGDALETLGLIYQIHDDLLGLYRMHSGRCQGGDLERQRLTAPIAVALDTRADDPARRQALLTELAGLAVQPAPDAVTRFAVALVEDGTLDAVLERADALRQAMLTDPALLSQPTALREIVRQLADELRGGLTRVRRRPVQASANTTTATHLPR